MSIASTLDAALTTVAPTWAVIAPAGAPTPRITFQFITGADDVSFAADPDGATSQHIQVDFWALTYGAAVALRDQARVAIFGALTVGGMTYNPDAWEEDTKLYRKSITVEVWE